MERATKVNQKTYNEKPITKKSGKTEDGYGFKKDMKMPFGKNTCEPLGLVPRGSSKK